MSKVHYHFDHVGSYLRPQALKEAREKFADGDISQDELLKVQDELVKDLVHHGWKMVFEWCVRRLFFFAFEV